MRINVTLLSHSLTFASTILLPLTPDVNCNTLKLMPVSQTVNCKVKQGFTLIELLIVITIIGILASLTLASYGGAQQKARDGIRKSDLAQMKRALELAKADCYGNAYYPYIGASDTLSNAENNYMTADGTAGVAVYLSNTTLKYISSAIKDPKNDATAHLRYSYYTGNTNANKCPDTAGGFTQGGASDYVLAALLERTTDMDATESRTKCGSTKPGYSVWNVAGYYVICNN